MLDHQLNVPRVLKENSTPLFIGATETFHIISGMLIWTETAIVAGKFKFQVIAMVSMW